MPDLTFDQGQENYAVNIGLTKLPRPHLSGMKLRGDVRINGLTLNTIIEDTEDPLYNTVFVCTDIENWWNLSTSEIPDIPRGLDDGSYDVRGRWLARFITLRGSILVPDPSKAPLARQKIMEAFNIVKTGSWLFVDEDPKKAAYVRLVGMPEITNVNARGRIDFAVPLKAGDPIKYGWEGEESGDGYTTTSITSSTSVTNTGNAEVSGIFTITGPITAPAYITNVATEDSSTQSIKVIQSLRAASYQKTTVSNRELQAGIATLTVPDHGFFAGDVVTVSSISTDFNATSVTLTSVSTGSISYAKPLVGITSITHTSNVITVTTSSSHGLSSGASFYISGSSNPLFDGSYTASTASGSTITATKTIANQVTGYGGNVSKQISSTSSTGTVTLVNADTLQIDTYNNSILYRGLADKSRSTLDADISWIKLKPGVNSLTFAATAGAGTASVKYRPGWIG